MFKVKARVEFSPGEVAAKFARQLTGPTGVQAKLASKVAMDTDGYVPMDTGTLATSPLRASDFEAGKIIYDEPYAKRLYYGDEFRFDDQKHAMATSRWFDWSKGFNIDTWGRFVARLIGGTWRKSG